MAYRFEYRASFWQDYSAALAYIAGSLKNPLAARELDEAQTEGSNPSGFAAGGSTTSPCRGGIPASCVNLEA